MSRSWNKRVSFTFNNQTNMYFNMDWLIVLHMFLCHLIATYGGLWFVVSVLSSDEDAHVAEGMVFLKILMFLLIYWCCIFLAMMLTGFPAVADWVESKEKRKRCKVRLW